MIAPKIGRTLLNAYNEKYNKNYSAKEFFEKEFFELFYNHPKYMQWVTNSPFVQDLREIEGEYGVKELLKNEKGDTLKFTNNDKNKLIKILDDVETLYGKSKILAFKVKLVTNKEQVYDKTKIDNYLQKGISQLQVIKKLNSSERQKKLQNFIDDIENIKSPDGSKVIGFPASEIKDGKRKFERTSGQVSNLDIPFSDEIAYLSWIGNGCGIGVKSGLSIYFDLPEVLLTIYEGWKIYRNDYLNNSALEKLEAKQINTWNGQWLTHTFGNDFLDDKPLIDFNPSETEKDKNENVISIKISVQNWTNIAFAVANKFPSSTVTGYIYKLGKVNTTIGFIPFNLPQVRKPIQLYKKLFGENEYLKNAKQIESLYGNPDAFTRACKMGSIGIKALRPKDLEGYVFPDKKGDLNAPDLKQSKFRKRKATENEEEYQDYQTSTENENQNKIFKFKTYITWIIAMLNENETLWDKAKSYAQTLRDYESSDKKLSTKKSNNVKTILEKPYKKGFIAALTELLKDKELDGKIIYTLANDADKMPKDNFPYFLTLIRFHYTFLKNQSSK